MLFKLPFFSTTTTTKSLFLYYRILLLLFFLTLKFCSLGYFLIYQLWVWTYGVWHSQGLQREFRQPEGMSRLQEQPLWLFLTLKQILPSKKKKKGKRKKEKESKKERQRTIVVRPCPNTCIWLFLHFLGMIETDIAKEQRKAWDGLCLKVH